MEPVNPYAAPQFGSATADAAPVPATFGDILTTAAKCYVQRFGAIAVITAITWGPYELIQSYLEYFVLDADDIMQSIQFSSLGELLVGFIATAAIIHVAIRNIRGERLAWSSSLGLGVAAWPRMFVTNLVANVILIIAALFFILPAVYLGVRYSLFNVITVVEGKVGLRALSRSMELTKQKFFWYAALALVAFGPWFLLLMGSELARMAIATYFDHWLLSAADSFLSDLITPWITVVYVAAYASETADFGQQSEPAIATTSALA